MRNYQKESDQHRQAVFFLLIAYAVLAFGSGATAATRYGDPYVLMGLVPTAALHAALAIGIRNDSLKAAAMAVSLAGLSTLMLPLHALAAAGEIIASQHSVALVAILPTLLGAVISMATLIMLLIYLRGRGEKILSWLAKVFSLALIASGLIFGLALGFHINSAGVNPGVFLFFHGPGITMLRVVGGCCGYDAGLVISDDRIGTIGAIGMTQVGMPLLILANGTGIAFLALLLRSVPRTSNNRRTDALG